MIEARRLAPIVLATSFLVFPTIGLSGPAAEKLGGANVQNARVAIAWFGDPEDDVARSKGVAKITVPTKGIYCIKVSGKSNITNVRKTVPIVSASADKTVDPVVLAVVATSSNDCPKNKTWLTVYAYVFDTNAFELSDGVSWNLIIP